MKTAWQQVTEFPGIRAIEEVLKTVLVLQPDNFTPAERTPWGGQKIRKMMGLSGRGIVGEAWVVSGHESFPSKVLFSSGKKRVWLSLALIGELFPNELYGRANVQLHGPRAPFLTKLIDAKEILSVQVHPTKEYAARFPGRGWHSKTEMWVILTAEKGAGLYLGLKEDVTKEAFSKAVADGGDISYLLNFVPVKKGDAFFIPAGTPHAIGAGVFLIEQEETSETTFRVYSWGDGRQLHKKDGIAAIEFDGKRGARLVESLRIKLSRISGGKKGLALREILAEVPEFSFERITFAAGDKFAGDALQGLHGLTVAEGGVEFLKKGKTLCKFEKGRSFIVPALSGEYGLKSKGGAVVFLGRGAK